MSRLLIVLVGVIAALGASRLSAAQASDKSGEAALARLQTLAGEWEGTFAWTGARKDRGAMNASYYVTGNNSAVVENLTMGGVPTMTTRLSSRWRRLADDTLLRRPKSTPPESNADR